MISFIVIGRNEERYLGKCLLSINKTIKLNDISKSEVIYIDSDIAKSFSDISIYKIKGEINAAVARNIGAEKSKGAVFIFIDGDMSLIPSNFKYLFDESGNLKHPFISGDFHDCYDNRRIRYHNNTKDVFDVATGGLFLITRDAWFGTGGMRNIFRRSQDLDFALRSSERGIRLLRICWPIANHYTIPYDNFRRFIKDMFDFNFLYKGLLYRKNLFNQYLYSKYIIKEISLFIFFAVSITLNLKIGIISYLLSLVFKVIIKGITNASKMLRQIIIYIICDFMMIVGFFLFFPREKKFTYEIIRP